MIYIHLCNTFINSADQKIIDIVDKKLNTYTSRDSLKGVGKVSNFTGGIYILLIKNPYHVEVIIEEKVLKYKEDTFKVYFVRGIKSGLSDYVNIRDGKWSKSNILEEKEIDEFYKKINDQSLIKPKDKNYPPEELVNWQNDFKLRVKYNIFESEKWVQYATNTDSEKGMALSTTELYKIIIQDVCDDNILIKQSKIDLLKEYNNYKLFSAELNDFAILYLNIQLADENYYLLITGARMKTQVEHWNTSIDYELISSIYNVSTYHDLCKIALKAYPSWVLKIPDLWLQIEKNSEFGNLSLLPEQTEFLNNFKFPKYINGQAGSGKSTMLYYLFANAYYYKCADEIKGDIIFLTENEKLLEHTKKSVRELLSYNSEFQDLTSDEVAISNLESHFFSFKDFLLKIIPEEVLPFSNQEQYINFPRFKKLYSESQIPLSTKQKYSAEYVWFILSTYIYGNDVNGEINSSNYQEKMPTSGKELISHSDFKRVETEIIKPYYEKWINENGYWDKIKLIKFIYKNFKNIKKYDIIFCDEAQDFSKVELEFILQLSSYSNYNLSQVPQFPIVFAGDALQTVNPTGFKTEVLTSMLYQELTNPKIGFRLEQQHLIYEPKFNYRSSQTIVNLANVIQYERKINHGATGTYKQVSKRPSFYINEHINIFIDENSLIDNDDLITKLKSKTIIVPVNSNEIEEFKEKNRILKNSEFSILSAVDAKGIDFNEVVIFKFGNHFKSIGDNNYEKQFFYNKLYVAVTRAQQELIIIDDAESKTSFWIKMIGNYFNSPWNENENAVKNINEILIYDVEKIKQSEARDVREDAISLKQQGIFDENVSLLKLASSNFFKLGDLKEYYLCLGEIEEIECKWLKAAEYYLKKEVKSEGFEKAAMAFVKAKEWVRLLEISTLVKSDYGKLWGILAKLFHKINIELYDIRWLCEKKYLLKDLLRKVNWKLDFYETLKKIYFESANKEDRNALLELMYSVYVSDDRNLIIFLIQEFFNSQQYDSVIDLYEDLGINYESNNNDLLKTYYKSKLEVSKRKNEIENIIFWLGSLGIKTDENKMILASEIISYYTNNKELIDKSTNLYTKLYAYFSHLILYTKDTDLLFFAQNVEKEFHSQNNEIGLAEEYYDLYKRNKLNVGIQNYVIERFVKNALQGGWSIEDINLKYLHLLNDTDLSYAKFTESEIKALPILPTKFIYQYSEHFSSLILQNFRRFKSLTINKIGLFNLILGDNNVGKTSLLEALLFSDDKNIYYERLAFAYIQRAGILPEKDLKSDNFDIYYNLSKSFFSEYISNSKENNKIIYDFTHKRTRWNFEIENESFDTKIIERLSYSRGIQMPLMPYGKGFTLDLAQVYYDVIVNSLDQNAEENFLSRLNLFISGAQKIIANPKDGSIKIRLGQTNNQFIPLHQFGDGANKLFRILILLTVHKGKRLMLDEIDSGIHYTKFKLFWRTILEVAMEDNTQLFATTHNEECIKYFSEVLIDLGEKFQNSSNIIQLENINNTIKAYTLDFESLNISVEDAHEIRGGKE